MNRNIISIFLLFFIDISQVNSQVSSPQTRVEGLERTAQLVYYHFGEGQRFDHSTGYDDVPNNSFVIPENEIPKVRSQNGAQLCELFCATKIIETEYCRQESFPDCRSIPNEKRISTVSTLIYRDSPGIEPIDSIASMVESENKEAFVILDKISSTPGAPVFFSESCLPFYEFTTRVYQKYKETDPNVTKYKALSQFFGDLEGIYSNARRDPKSAELATITNCEACLKLVGQFKHYFEINSDVENIHQALKKPNFKKFIFTMLFEETLDKNPKCSEIVLKRVISFQHFPLRDSSKSATPTSMADAIAVVKNKIKDGTPVLVSNLCLAHDPLSKRCSIHCVVMTGLKKVKNRKTGEIIELVQVQNSWGQDWQDATNGGWIKLDTFMSRLTTADDSHTEKPAADRKKRFANTFSWLKQTN